LAVTLGTSLLSDGSFSSGTWGLVGDCYDVLGAAGRAGLHAAVLPAASPGRQPALQLSASDDSACEAQAMTWHGGSIFLSMWIEHVAGASARICLWESTLNECSALPQLPAGSGWHRYQVVFTPARGTTAETLFLYADATNTSQHTVNRYAQIQAEALPNVGTPLVIAHPPGALAPGGIVVAPTSYSTLWQVTRGEHVEVDGLRNGWLGAVASAIPSYRPTRLIQASDGFGLATPTIVGAAVLLTWTMRRRSARRRHRPEQTE
jgi:hypothetical protein